jgi:hypothetical protein
MPTCVSTTQEARRKEVDASLGAVTFPSLFFASYTFVAYYDIFLAFGGTGAFQTKEREKEKER